MTTTSGNGTFNHYGMTTAEVITLTVVSGVISSVGTVSNILVIFAVLLTRQLRESCTAVLLISLSLSDCLICGLYVPFYISDINNGSSTIIEAVRFKMGFACFFASLNGELIVTLDRFVCICYPYRYINWTSTNHLALAASCAQWFLALVLTLPLLAKCTLWYSLVYIVIAIAVTSILHLSMYCVARREGRRIAHQFPTGSHHPRMPIWSKSAIAVTMAVMASLLCRAPLLILPLILPVTSPSFKRYIKVATAFTSLGAAIHPFIFCWKLSYFREALIACLRKLRSAFG